MGAAGGRAIFEGATDTAAATSVVPEMPPWSSLNALQVLPVVFNVAVLILPSPPMA